MISGEGYIDNKQPSNSDFQSARAFRANINKQERASGGSSCMRGHVSDQHSRLVSFQARSAYLNNNAGVNSTSHRLPCDVFWLQQSSTTGPFIVKMQKFFLQVMPYSKMERGAVYNFLSHGCFGFLSSLPRCGSVVRDATLVSSLGTRKR